MDTSLIMAAAACGKCCGPLVQNHPHLVAAGLFAAGAVAGFACAKLLGGKKKQPAQRPQRSGDSSRSKEPRRSSESRVPIPAGSVEIYAGNLSYDMTDDQLRGIFAKYGVVESARIITHRPSGKSKGYGFVEMPHRAEAELAVDKINNTEVMGRRIRCNEAREDSRPDR